MLGNWGAVSAYRIYVPSYCRHKLPDGLRLGTLSALYIRSEQSAYILQCLGQCNLR